MAGRPRLRARSCRNPSEPGSKRREFRDYLAGQKRAHRRGLAWIARHLGPRGGRIALDDGSSVLVHKATRTDGKAWQVTFVLPDGRPSGHLTADRLLPKPGDLDAGLDHKSAAAAVLYSIARGSAALTAAMHPERRNPDSITYRVEIDDAHRGESFGRAVAYAGDRRVGVAPFSAYSGLSTWYPASARRESKSGSRSVVRVGIVEVAPEYRRRGVGMGLLRALRSEFGANRVELGMSVSPEGARLTKAWERARRNPARKPWGRRVVCAYCGLVRGATARQRLGQPVYCPSAPPAGVRSPGHRWVRT